MRRPRPKLTLRDLQRQIGTLVQLTSDLQGRFAQVPTLARTEAKAVIDQDRAELQALIVEARLALRALVDATERARAAEVSFGQSDLNAAVGRG